MLFDPAHQFAVSMRIMRPQKDVSVTTQRVEAATEAVASC